jgi:hypothetical protein
MRFEHLKCFVTSNVDADRRQVPAGPASGTVCGAVKGKTGSTAGRGN